MSTPGESQGYESDAVAGEVAQGRRSIVVRHPYRVTAGGCVLLLAAGAVVTNRVSFLGPAIVILFLLLATRTTRGRRR